MTLFLPRLFLITTLTTALFTCQTNNHNATAYINIEGSNTAQPIVQSLIDTYNASNTSVNFTLKGKGSATGISALINGSTTIANSSRKMTPQEHTQFKTTHGEDPVSIIFAVDAVAFITHPENPVDSLSTLEVAGILSGDITNWAQLGGTNHPIQLVGRNDASGTHAFLEQHFIHHHNFANGMIHCQSTPEVIDVVKTNPYAIGYTGASFLIDENGKPNSEIWAVYLYIDGENRAFSPYEYTSVTNGNYPIVRPLYQYFNPKASSQVYDFINFELSPEGQSAIYSQGFYPISPIYESKNEENGFSVNS